jgi:hypothetical protein
MLNMAQLFPALLLLYCCFTAALQATMYVSSDVGTVLRMLYCSALLL